MKQKLGRTQLEDLLIVNNVDLANDVTGILSTSNLPISAVTPGSYTNTNLTVDGWGRITSASNGGGGISIGGTVSGSTNYDVLYVDGSGNLAETSPNTAGYLFISNG